MAGRRFLPLLVVPAAIVVLAVLRLDPRAGWSLLAGLAAGLVSLGGVVLRVRSLTEGRGRPLLLPAMRWVVYLIFIGLLYVIVMRWHADVLWLIIGYTYTLVGFAITMAGGPTGPRRPL